jgi:Ca-activated chloride channel family protein
VVELSFPNRLEVIDAVLSAYQSDLRRPATSIFVLDVSGSMKGARLAQMKEALKLLSGAEASAASQRYAAFQARERVLLIPFSGLVGQPARVQFAAGDLQAASARCWPMPTAWWPTAARPSTTRSRWPSSRHARNCGPIPSASSASCC